MNRCAVRRERTVHDAGGRCAASGGEAVVRVLREPSPAQAARSPGRVDAAAPGAAGTATLDDHVQHVHGGAQGQCPTMSADKDGDGVISTTEGGPSYGGIQTTLSTSGDTSPAAGTTLEVAPAGGSFDYSRTFEMNQPTIDALKAGTAVIVVHGLDPATLPAAAQNEPSDLVPSLPLAATSPALCGTLTASQMPMPNGAAATGAAARRAPRRRACSRPGPA